MGNGRGRGSGVRMTLNKVITFYLTSTRFWYLTDLEVNMISIFQ